MRILVIDRLSRACQSRKTELDARYQASVFRKAGNACEALHLLEKFLPELFLVDVRMPNDHGLQAIQLIKARIPSLQVLVLSLDPNLKASALTAGADAFISKNDPPEMLMEAIHEGLCGLEMKAGHLVEI
ncbi:MAG TPA: response regulator transcription factor [Anaerolineales bacterium]|nr:response regulator transcription factor [Anaerolineales bacterium]